MIVGCDSKMVDMQTGIPSQMKPLQIQIGELDLLNKRNNKLKTLSYRVQHTAAGEPLTIYHILSSIITNQSVYQDAHPTLHR